MKRRNFVPVTVWKHVIRNLSVSRTSRPVFGWEGFGRAESAGEEVEELPAAVEGVVDGTWGVRERVMAWTLG